MVSRWKRTTIISWQTPRTRNGWALLEANVACFMLGRGDLSANQMASALLAALPRFHRVLRRFDVPLAASVTATGHVSLLMAHGRLLDPPRQVK
jgi:hypothetical protein